MTANNTLEVTFVVPPVRSIKDFPEGKYTYDVFEIFLLGSPSLRLRFRLESVDESAPLWVG